MNKIKNYFKRLWKALLDSTELDERAIAAIAEAKVRVDEMKKELADVKKAATTSTKKKTGKKPYYKNKKKKRKKTL